MPTVKLTAASIKSLPIPERGQVDYWDETLHGFGCRVSEGGVRSWVLAYRFNGRTRRWTIGRHPDIDLVAARKRAGKALLQISEGKDPGAEKIELRASSTFGDLADEYLTLHAKRKKKSWRMDEYMLNRELLPLWRHSKVRDIARRDVRLVLERIADPEGRNGPIYANRVRALIHKMFNFALARDYGIDFNPCTGVEKPGRDRARDRVLTTKDIRTFWAAVEEQGEDKPAVAAFLKLRLLTAQRGGEVANMRWADVDWAGRVWTIPGEFAKNGLQHRVPLSRQAIDLLKAHRQWVEQRNTAINAGRSRKGWEPKAMSDWAFRTRRLGRETDQGDAPLDPKVAKTMKLVREKCGIQDLCAHDLRRTAASLMSQMGVPRVTLKKILNHVDRDITAVYDRYSYDPEKRAALDAWAKRLDAILAGRDSVRVLTFSRRA